MINHWMFKCKDIANLVSRSLDERLPLRIKFGIKFHLWMCRICSNYEQQIYLISNAISKLNIQEEQNPCSTPLPDDVVKKMKEYLKNLDKTY